MRLIDGDALRAQMYHDAFETDSDMQKWDSGCWIRYKMFENAIENAPTIESKQRWIPCHDRLPAHEQEDMSFLVSFAYGGVGIMEWKSSGWHPYGAFNPVPFEAVIAWMSLPEPYREEI